VAEVRPDTIDTAVREPESEHDEKKVEPMIDGSRDLHVSVGRRSRSSAAHGFTISPGIGVSHFAMAISPALLIPRIDVPLVDAIQLMLRGNTAVPTW